MFVKDVMEMYGSGTKSMDMDSFRIQNDPFLSRPHIAFSYVGQTLEETIPDIQDYLAGQENVDQIIDFQRRLNKKMETFQKVNNKNLDEENKSKRADIEEFVTWLQSQPRGYSEYLQSTRAFANALYNQCVWLDAAMIHVKNPVEYAKKLHNNAIMPTFRDKKSLKSLVNDIHSNCVGRKGSRHLATTRQKFNLDSSESEDEEPRRRIKRKICVESESEGDDEPGAETETPLYQYNVIPLHQRTSWILIGPTWWWKLDKERKHRH